MSQLDNIMNLPGGGCLRFWATPPLAVVNIASNKAGRGIFITTPHRFVNSFFVEIILF